MLQFLHKASLLIPAKFAETKTAADRRRMWRTRQAHKAREQWLEKVMHVASIQGCFENQKRGTRHRRTSAWNQWHRPGARFWNWRRDAAVTRRRGRLRYEFWLNDFNAPLAKLLSGELRVPVKLGSLDI